MNLNNSPTPEPTYPQLARLQVTADELESLRRQGFLSREVRGPGKRAIYKLRYRVGGRQRVKYVGTDWQVARDVAQELESLQRKVRTGRQLARTLTLSRQLEREFRESATRLLASLGYRFHGRELRKQRRRVDAQE